MSATPAVTAEPGHALAHHDSDGIERLKRKPIIDTVEPRTLALIQKQIAPGCDHAEIGHFLELCAHYDLDPFAREAWIAKGGKGGKLLILVGRDGLRRIAQRNGLHVDGDVVRAKDEFTICRTPDGNRTVTHSYGNPAQRGDIIGAWAECREGGPLGRPMGYFYAPLSEYQPKGASDYSPWSKQVGVMILAAAERQAIRQATPLSGLLAVGEDESAFAKATIGEGRGDGQPAGLDLGPDVEKVLSRAAELGHAGLADRATVEMQLGNQPPARVVAWVRAAHKELDDIPTDAEVIEPQEAAQSPTASQATEHPFKASNGPQEPPQAAGKGESPPAPSAEADPKRIEALRRRVSELLDAADTMDVDNDPRAEEVREEAMLIAATIEAETSPEQTALGFGSVA